MTRLIYYDVTAIKVILSLLVVLIGPSEVRAPAVGVAHAGGERSVHY